MSDNNRIVIGITGGIAAYKVPQLIRLLKAKGAETKVVLTPNSRSLVGEEALRTVSGYPVYHDQSTFYDMEHIRLAEWAQKLLICPATANTIAKIAHGIADNLLTTLALSVKESQIIIAPAMNTVMWESKATQENIKILLDRGITVLPVGFGKLACDITGPGRMIDIEDIVSYVMSASSSKQIFKGKKILISSGPTEEPIDPVRVITNRSSGKMGVAFARQALIMGADVTVVSGPSQESFPSSVKVISVKTAQEMQDALHKEFANTDICIMAAAVSDYRVAHFSESKLQRNEQGTLLLELLPNPDILAGLGKAKSNQFITGFALESGNDESRALEKMEKKGCDLIVFNRADKALGLDTTQVTILGRDNFREVLPAADKMNAARMILEQISKYIGCYYG